MNNIVAKHVKIILSLNLILLIQVLALLIIALYSNQFIQRQFLKNVEKNAQIRINLYHQSQVAFVKDHLERYGNQLLYMARDKSLRAAIESDNKTRVDQELKRLGNSYPMKFSTISVIDHQGEFQNIYSLFPDVNKLVGSNVSDRKYFQQAEENRIYIGEIIKGRAKYEPILTYSTKFILDDKSSYVLLGSFQITQIENRIELLDNDLGMFFSILIDDKGNVISNGAESENGLITNISGKDTLADELMTGEDELFKKEYNYLGKEVLAKGEKLKLENGTGNLYLINYFPLEQIKNEKMVMKNELNRLLLGIIGIIILINFAVGLFVIYTIEKRSKRINS